MRKKQMLAVLLMAMMSVSVIACDDNDPKQTLEEQEPAAVTMNNFNYYFDMWYKDGSIDEISVLLDVTGTWEVYDAMGLIGGGTLQIDTATNNALILLDEAGKQAAYVQVDDSDVMNMEVYNEELMKLPQTCTLYRESACR